VPQAASVRFSLADMLIQVSACEASATSALHSLLACYLGHSLHYSRLFSIIDDFCVQVCMWR
jgi:hypothetical protein